MTNPVTGAFFRVNSRGEKNARFQAYAGRLFQENHGLRGPEMPRQRKSQEMTALSGDFGDRGGNGLNGDGSWPETDGRGCPLCGAIGGGGHGGGCELWKFVYDEDGCFVGRNPPEDPVAAIEHDLRDMRKP